MHVFTAVTLVVAIWFCGLLKLTIALTPEFQNSWYKKVTIVKWLSGLGLEPACLGLNPSYNTYEHVIQGKRVNLSFLICKMRIISLVLGLCEN